MNTILWHDYETFGVNPALDRPSQFAAIRTNLALEPVDDPIMLYCAPTNDFLPSIDACLVTGITPQETAEKGLPEPEFVKTVHAEFARPNTCGAGYNSIRFDDEVTRHCLYRNFYDPYAREWQNGNSRWDIIDMARATYALRPEGIEWPESEPGIPSFRLELLTQVNGLTHESAHDALSDVRATIALAGLIRDRHPKLYEYCWKLRDKKFVGQLIDLRSHKPLVHVSSKFPAKRGCTSLVMPLISHPQNNNGIICIDLTVDPETWLGLSADQMLERLYKKSEALEEGEQRLPIKTVHLNRSPMVCPASMLDDAAQNRLGIDISASEAHWQRLLAEPDLDQKIRALFAEPFTEQRDVEASLYSGFIPKADQAVCAQVREAGAKDFELQAFVFEDARLSELLLRYKARHFPESLSTAERLGWEEEIAKKYFGSAAEAETVYEAYSADLLRRLETVDQESEKIILQKLKQWMLDFHQRYNRA